MKEHESGCQLDLAKIEAYLQTKWLGRSLANELWPTIDSTNNRAKELVNSACPDGLFVIASAQSAGRGRSGRVWHSPANSGLYMSFVLRPKLEAVNLPIITLLAGVALAQAIQSYLGIKVGLKWVNDLIIEGKKVGGILAEYQGNAASAALILGIGLNLHKPPGELPLELKSKMGFLEDYLAADFSPIDPNKLFASIANELEQILEQQQAGKLQALLDQWRAHSITLGEEIKATIGGEEIIGQALDIDNSGGLIVKTISGNIILPAGEVSIRKPDGSYI